MTRQEKENLLAVYFHIALGLARAADAHHAHPTPETNETLLGFYDSDTGFRQAILAIYEPERYPRLYPEDARAVAIFDVMVDVTDWAGHCAQDGWEPPTEEIASFVAEAADEIGLTDD